MPLRQYINTPIHYPSLVVQYLKHQHQQCPASITTLAPLSILHCEVHPEPTHVSDVFLNTAGRLAICQMCPPFGGHRRDRHFLYNHFWPWWTCSDEPALLTATTFLGYAYCLADSSHAGVICLFDSSNILEMYMGYASPRTLLQSAPTTLAVNGGLCTGQLLLSSTSYNVRLWNSSALSSGSWHLFEDCWVAHCNQSCWNEVLGL
jgi:HIV-1 Vpr-binding protein